jgi:hypothetical protein
VLVVVALVVLVPQSWATAGDFSRYGNPADALQSTVADAYAAVVAALDEAGNGEAVTDEAANDGAGSDVELHVDGEGAGWIADAVGLQLERAGWDVVVVRNDLNVGKWGWRRTVEAGELKWGERTDRPGDGGRPGVWVLGDPVQTPPIDITDPRVTMVFSDDDVAVGPVRVFVAR